jgi:geranylgeranyl pyrophosphate synthase
MAFQVVDDLLDVEGDEDVTGKPVGIDLRDGNPSLPLVLALEDAEVRRVFVTPEPAEAQILAALERVRRLGVLTTVRDLAEEYTGRAREVIAGLPHSPYRQALDGIVTEIEERRL